MKGAENINTNYHYKLTRIAKYCLLKLVFSCRKNLINGYNCQFCMNTFLACVDVNVAANNDRVRIEPYDPTVTTWSIETYCSPNVEPGLEEYNVIVKQG